MGYLYRCCPNNWLKQWGHFAGADRLFMGIRQQWMRRGRRFQILPVDHQARRPADRGRLRRLHGSGVWCTNSPYLLDLIITFKNLIFVFFYSKDGYCHVNNVTLTAKMTGFVNVTPRDPDALKVAIAKHGPISIAIDASHKTFSFYSHGVYYDPACGEFFVLPLVSDEGL